jgi:hypothetical protein
MSDLGSALAGLLALPTILMGSRYSPGAGARSATRSGQPVASAGDQSGFGLPSSNIQRPGLSVK